MGGRADGRGADGGAAGGREAEVPGHGVGARGGARTGTGHGWPRPLAAAPPTALQGRLPRAQVKATAGVTPALAAPRSQPWHLETTVCPPPSCPLSPRLVPSDPKGRPTSIWTGGSTQAGPRELPSPGGVQEKAGQPAVLTSPGPRDRAPYHPGSELTQAGPALDVLGTQRCTAKQHEGACVTQPSTRVTGREGQDGHNHTKSRKKRISWLRAWAITAASSAGGGDRKLDWGSRRVLKAGDSKGPSAHKATSWK
ncbi:translation initiation factor IF-2-like [Pteropus medius]|uniref:translation initiation factor IF-2-like n=1 Tax=Pteropus vampyrus TaxID=132908 RepID=UPI00196B261C|nr:translation initiation factor IF-2-like [Pteropus giganteus]